MAAKSAFKKRVYLYSTALLICSVLLSVIIFPPDGSSRTRWSVDFNPKNRWQIRKVQVPDSQITFLLIGPVTISWLPRDSKAYFTQSFTRSP